MSRLLGAVFAAVTALPLAASAAIAHPPSIGAALSVLLVEADSGLVLFEHKAKTPRPPASMVKMMVALLTFEAISSHQISLDDPVTVSRKAAGSFGSRIYLDTGEQLPLSDLLNAMLLASANDASIVVAEAVAGSVHEMLRNMNNRARELGMFDSVYTTVNGLPPRGHAPRDMTTAHDLAILARELVRLGDMLEFSSKAHSQIRNGRTHLRNTNRLIGHMDGVDGLKTGYYRSAGFNLTATGQRDGMRLISVVLGCPNLRCRFDVSREVLEWGFRNYQRTRLLRAGDPLSIDVDIVNGTRDTLRPIAAKNSSYLLQRNEIRDLKIRFQIPARIVAPVTKNQPLGEIIIEGPSGVLDVVPALAPETINSN